MNILTNPLRILLILCTTLLFTIFFLISKQVEYRNADILTNYIMIKDRDNFSRFLNKDNMNSMNKGGNTAAMMAAYAGDRDMLTQLTDLSADMSLLNITHENTLMMAAVFVPGSDITDIIKATPNIDEGDMYGQSALTWAIFYNDTNASIQLLKAGANPFHKDHFNIMPFDIAAFRGNKAVLEWILENKKIDHLSAVSGDYEHIMKIIFPETLDALVKNGSDMNKPERNYGDTALMTAIHINSKKQVDYIIKQGAFIDQQNKLGMTALHIAAIRGQKETFRDLLNKGASCSIKDLGGNLASDYLDSKNKLALKRLLDHRCRG